MISITIAADLRAAIPASKIFNCALKFFHTGADGGTRTHKPLRAKDFKSFVYTNSTTSARLNFFGGHDRNRTGE